MKLLIRSVVAGSVFLSSLAKLFAMLYVIVSPEACIWFALFAWQILEIKIIDNANNWTKQQDSKGLEYYCTFDNTFFKDPYMPYL